VAYFNSLHPLSSIRLTEDIKLGRSGTFCGFVKRRLSS